MAWTDKLANYLGYTRVGRKETWHPFSLGDSLAVGAITPDRAMRLSAVMACVRIISRTIASLPLHVYKDLPGGGKEKDKAYHLYRILHTQPNKWQTSSEFRMMMQAHLCLRGNGYSRKVFGSYGYVEQLIPLLPDTVTIERTNNGELRYIQIDPQTQVKTVYTPEQILHIRNISLDGVKGLSPIAYAAETLGTSLATDQYGASFFRNGASVGNILESKGALTDKAIKRLADGLQKFTGSHNAGKTLILEEETQWKRMGMSPAEAQFLEGRKFNVVEICRVFGVPPHKVADLERATFSNIEEQGLEFVQDCILPWCVSWEQAISRDLIPDSEQDHFAKFLLDGLWRGKLEDRTKALAMQLQNGALNQDEWREIEDRNPIPNGIGQKFFTPMNLQKGGPGGDTDVMNAWIDDMSRRIATYESREIGKAKNMDAFMGNRVAYMTSILTPWLEVLGKNPQRATVIAKNTGKGMTVENVNVYDRMTTLTQELLMQVQK